MIERWWNEVFHHPPNANTLLWEQRDEDNDAIAKYLSKSEKGGRGVKGKAEWLTFKPYFTTGLPPMEREVLSITRDEADNVLGPYSMTYGAVEKLSALRDEKSKPVA
jgi:hypothetical protein